MKEKISGMGIIQNKKVKYFFVYTICFLILAASIFSVFLRYQHTFVWKPDGLQQHFNALLYYRRYLRNFLSDLFFEHRISIPMWDADIGLGSDIITTLHYYVIGDPLNLCSVLVPDESYMEAFFSGLVVVRIYLAGLTFSMYCFAHKKEWYPTLLGALIYAFCYWSIVSIRHPYFINPMIYLPLILLGVDRIYAKKKAGLYMTTLAVAAISSFYFTYMLCIFIVIYAVVRYLMLVRKIQMKAVFQWIGRFMIYSLTALSMAAAILFPVVAMTLSTGRAKAKNYLPMFYPIGYYIKIISGFLNGGSSYWSYLGYTAFGVLGVIILFTYKKRFKALKASFFLLLMFLAVPFAGHIMNGGSYVINRYMWAFSMLVAYIVVKAYTILMHIDEKHKQRMLLVSLWYLGFCLIYNDFNKDKSMLIPSLLFFLLLIILFLIKPVYYKNKSVKFLLLLLLLVSLSYQGNEKYSPDGENYVSEFAKKGEALTSLADGAPSAQIKKINTTQFWRYEECQTGEWKNTAMQQKLHGTAYYFSLANPAVNQFQREMYLNQTRDFCYSNLDGRAALDVLFSVRYFLIPERRKDLLPYGFESFVSQSKAYPCSLQDKENIKQPPEKVKWNQIQCYENTDYLPLGFTYSKAISRKTYEKLSVIEKQQALLQGAVVEQSTLPEAKLHFTARNLSYKIEETHGVTIANNKIHVTQEHAKATISFQGWKDCETYFVIKGLQYEDTESGQLMKRRVDRVHINAECEGVKKKLIFLSSENNFYSNIHEYLLNLGYRKHAVKKIQLDFPEKGTFSFKEMQVICQPMATLRTNSKVLGKETLQNIELKPNKLTGDITVSEDKMLCISFPYSKGWNAYVDGKQTEIKQTDTMFLGIELKQGHHTIELHYITPMLKPGMIITVCGVGFFLLLLTWNRRQRKKKCRGENIWY